MNQFIRLHKADFFTSIYCQMELYVGDFFSYLHVIRNRFPVLLFFLLSTFKFSVILAEEVPDLFKQQVDSGTAKLHQGDFPAALNHFFNALEISSEDNSNDRIASSHSSLGTVYYRMREWDKAMEHLNTAEALAVKIKSEDKLAEIIYKKGLVYDEIPGETQKAFSHLQKALQIFKKKNNCVQLADAYNALAGHYYMQRKTDSVEHYAIQALRKYEECGTQQQQAAMNINIAALLNSQLKHTEAVEYNRKGIELAQKINSYSQLRQGYKNLSETYAYMGVFDKAYENRVIYDQYKDSVFSEDKNKLAAELSSKYETEKKNKLLAEQKSEITKHKFGLLLLAIGLLIALILSGTLYYISYLRRMKNKQLYELNASKDKLFSIISHDLKSPVMAQQRAVNTIIENIQNFDNEMLLENLRGFQSATDTQLDLLQNLLSWTNIHTGRMVFKPTGFNINDVIDESVQLYAIAARNKKIDVEIDISQKCNVFADRQMMLVIIRNLINNAIKFTHINGKIVVKCTCTENSVNISVKDNGVGMDSKTLTAILSDDKKQVSIGTHGEVGSGLGLMLCKDLLKRHGSHLNVKSELGKGSEVSFEISKIG